MADEPTPPVEEQTEPPAEGLGAVLTLTVHAEVIRGDQNEDPEETR